MRSRTPFYLIGLVTAGVLAAILCDINGLEALSSQSGMRNLPAEVRLANETGIFRLPEGIRHSLRQQTHGRVLIKLIHDMSRVLGVADPTEPSLVKTSGVITKRVGSGHSLSRRDTIETLARYVQFLRNTGMINWEPVQGAGFPDYQCPEDLKDGISFLQTARIIRGYHNGSISPNRRISLQETIMLVYRTYEQVAILKNAEKRDGKTYFVDLPMDHYMTQRVQFLETIGAFTAASLGYSFDGNRFISRETFTAMVGGIMKQAFQADRMQEIQATLAGKNPAQPITRGQMVLLMEMVIRVFGAKAPQSQRISYADVTAGSPLDNSAQVLGEVGIRVGYADFRMAPDEPVTRFEAISLLEAVMKRVQVFEPVCHQDLQESLQKYPEKHDLNNFVNLIRAKQARIRELLNRKPGGNGQ
jgi:hypothetical protein